MPRESYTERWDEAGMEWADDFLRPMRAETRAHPWLGVAAALAAGVMLGAISRPRNEIRIRLAPNERLIIGPRPEALLEEDEEEQEEEAPTESSLRRLARSAGEPLRRMWEEEEVEESPLERVRSAVRSGVEGLAERLPGRQPPSRMRKLRDALEDAIPGRRPKSLADRVKRALS